jgi:cytochrome c
MATVCIGGWLPSADGEVFDPARFEREVLVAAAEDPVALDVASDGTVYFAERPGRLKRWQASTRAVSEVGRVPSLAKSDAGCLGLVLAPDFAATGHLYLLYVPEGGRPELRVARFTVRDGRLADGSEKVLLAIPLEGGDGPAHCGGALGWDAHGNLLVGTGDNSPPQDVPAVHPDEAARDSRRSAANSQDLRGKILRIRPTPDGGYGVPEGNMFRDPADGRPEIFVMGTRNPFRLTVDPTTGWLIWGDVGGNVDPAFDLGPEGYDELNLAKAPGFFGWPFCSGPNAPWRSFDPKTREPRGAWFDPAHPVNDSPANTGLKSLPAAIPAVFWYPTSASAEWPQVGSGGRSITSGPVYRFDRYAGSEVRLPQAFDGAVLWGEWMRNFLAIARLSPEGTLLGVERLMPDTVFRKPSELRLGPDGALYIAEYGDAWSGNTAGQITRVVYRRGNRAPRVAATASAVAGPAPLQVVFDAAGSTDADAGDRGALVYTWDFQDGATGEGSTVSHVFEEPGRYAVALTVRDPQGAEGRVTVAVAVGNTAPVVRFAEPMDGGFFEYGAPIAYRLEANDAEDGVLGAEKISVQYERRDRVREEDEESAFPGLAVMRAGTCFSCHRAAEKSAGPAYIEIARRYAAEPGARELLVQKILRGGSGVWGEAPMPPHPQHSEEQGQLMLDWILSLAARNTHGLPPGTTGTVRVEPPTRDWGGFSNGVVVLTAAATDAGTAEAPPLSTESRITLRTRRQLAAAFDRAERTSTQHNLETGLVARTQAGGWIAFERVLLADVREVRVQLRPAGGGAARLEIRATTPDGPLLAKAAVPTEPPRDRRAPALSLALEIPPGLGGAPADLFFRVIGDPGAACDIEWIEFR